MSAVNIEANEEQLAQLLMLVEGAESPDLEGVEEDIRQALEHPANAAKDGGERSSEADDALRYPPIADCLVCGHDQQLAVWREGTNIGVCRDCRDLAAANRGPCSPARDCACWHRGTYRGDA